MANGIVQVPQEVCYCLLIILTIIMIITHLLNRFNTIIPQLILHHLSPKAVATIGHSDQANHQYNLSMFWEAVDNANLPSVSFLKAATSQQGHPEISDPLKEQTFLVNTLNHLQNIPQWNMYRSKHQIQ